MVYAIWLFANDSSVDWLEDDNLTNAKSDLLKKVSG